jgi:hypothetical protein
MGSLLLINSNFSEVNPSTTFSSATVWVAKTDHARSYFLEVAMRSIIEVRGPVLFLADISPRSDLQHVPAVSVDNG